MTHEEIIAMAREAEISLETMVLLCGVEMQVTASPLSVDELARFADLVTEKAAAKEREACEKACAEVARRYEEQHRGCFPDGMVPAEMGADDCVEAIRARGQKEGV
jgi:hypothetical protein